MAFSNFALFCSHVAGLGTQFTYLLMVAMVRHRLTMHDHSRILISVTF